MTFAWPVLLWLTAVPLLLLAAGLLGARRAAATAAKDSILRGSAGSGQVTLGDAPTQAPRRRTRPLLCLACAAALLALARPQWGVIDEPVFTTSREILLGMDLSRSMLGTDIKPSRLDRSRLLVQSLLDRLAGERVGLVLFSGTAFLQCPLSTDYEILRDMLPSLGPDYLPEGGTAYDALLGTSLEAFGKAKNTDRFLIVLSDGEALDEGWKTRLKELKERNIRVIALGVGTLTGSMIPDGQGAFVKDERGAVVLSRLEPLTLETLARETGGAYRNAGSWLDLSTLLRETVEAGRAQETVERQQVRKVERFQWPLALALALALLSLAHEFPGRIRPRTMKLAGAATKTATRAALVLLALALLGQGRLGAQGTAQPVPTSPALPSAAQPAPEPRIIATVRELAPKGSLDAMDCKRIANDTLSWGRDLRQKKQSFPQGPVQDALQAVGLGEKADPAEADWKRLRAELEELLVETKDDKQDQKQENQDKQGQDNKDKQQEPQDGQQKQPEQQQEKNKQQEQRPQDQKEPSEKAKPEQDSKQPEKPKAFGEMPPKEEPQQSQQEEMQQVGGQQEKRPANEDPSMVVPLEKLEKLKKQDNPGRLFELMQDEKKPQPDNKKNW